MIAHIIKLDVLFPNGVHSGISDSGNVLEIARNGNGKGDAVIRGTSIAGVIRHKVKDDTPFGKEIEGKETDAKSKIKFYDMVLQNSQTQIDTHNAISRHTGSAIDGSLYSLEKVLGGANGKLVFIVYDDDGVLLEFIKEVLSIINDSLIIGGSSNRGVGLLEVTSGNYNGYDLSNHNDYADYLDAVYKINKGDYSSITDALPIFEKRKSQHYTLKIKIAEGQDILVSDGAMFPMVSGGKWIIPGSTLRGLFKNYMTRLAMKEGKNVLDTCQRYKENEHCEVKAKSFEEDKKFGDDCLILDLFGSPNKKGRLHISNAYADKNANKGQTQERTHVAIDRFTGGGIDKALFSNYVLVDSSLEFESKIIINGAEAHETWWLEKTVKALNNGILRIGSSKASGRVNATLEKGE